MGPDLKRDQGKERNFKKNTEKSKDEGIDVEFLEKSFEYGLENFQKKAVDRLKEMETRGETEEEKSLEQLTKERDLIRDEIKEIKRSVDITNPESVENYLEDLAQKIAKERIRDNRIWEKETGHKLPTRKELEEYEEEIKDALKKKAAAEEKTTKDVLQELGLSVGIELDWLPRKSLEEIRNLIEDPESVLSRYTDIRVDVDRLKQNSFQYNAEFSKALMDFYKNLENVKYSFKKGEINEEQYKEKMKKAEERKKILELLPRAESPKKIDEFFAGVEIMVSQKAKEISKELKTEVNSDDIWNMLSNTFVTDRFLFKGQIDILKQYYKEELRNITYNKYGKLIFKERSLTAKEKEEYYENVDRAVDEFLASYSIESRKYDEDKTREMFEEMSNIFGDARQDFLNSLSGRQKKEQYWCPTITELDEIEEELKNKLKRFDGYSDERFKKLINGLPMVAEKRDLEGMKALLEKIGREEFSKVDLRNDELEEKLELARVVVQANQLKKSLDDDIREITRRDLVGIDTKEDIMGILEDVCTSSGNKELPLNSNIQKIAKRVSKYGSLALASLVVAVPIAVEEILHHADTDSGKNMEDLNITKAVEFQKNNPKLWKAINESYFKRQQDVIAQSFGFNNTNLTLFLAESPKVIEALETEQFSEVREALINREKSVNFFVLADILRRDDGKSMSEIIYRVNLSAVDKEMHKEMQKRIDVLEEGQKKIIREQEASEINITEQMKKEHKDIEEIGLTNLRKSIIANRKLDAVLENSKAMNDTVSEILNNGTKIDQRNEQALESIASKVADINKELNGISNTLFNDTVSIVEAVNKLDDVSKDLNDLGKEVHQTALDANATNELLDVVKGKVDDVYDLVLVLSNESEKPDAPQDSRPPQVHINASELDKAGKSFYDKFGFPDDYDLYDILNKPGANNLTSEELTWLMDNRTLNWNHLSRIITGTESIYQNLSSYDLYLFTKQAENSTEGTNFLFSKVLDHASFYYDNHAVLEIITKSQEAQNDVLEDIASQSTIPEDYLDNIAKNPNFYSWDKLIDNPSTSDETMRYILENENLAYYDIQEFMKNQEEFLLNNQDLLGNITEDDDFWSSRYLSLLFMENYYDKVIADQKENFVQSAVDKNHVDYFSDESKSKILNDPDIPQELKNVIDKG